MKLLHKILKGASLTTALFVLEACYGVPEHPLYEERGEAPMYFQLLDKANGNPIPGIHIYVATWDYQGKGDDLGVTGADGLCHINLPYARNQEGPFIKFEDPNGIYAPKDTTLADLRERKVVVKLEAAAAE